MSDEAFQATAYQESGPSFDAAGAVAGAQPPPAVPGGPEPPPPMPAGPEPVPPMPGGPEPPQPMPPGPEPAVAPEIAETFPAPGLGAEPAPAPGLEAPPGPPKPAAPGAAPAPAKPAAPPAPPARPAPAAAPQEDVGPRRVIGALLLSYQDDAYGKQWILHDGENLVGRAETNVKCDVPIAHGTTSTRHATIRCGEDEVTIIDMKSTNGTYHNGRRITANTPARLRSGDKLRFGGYSVYIFFAPSRQ